MHLFSHFDQIGAGELPDDTVLTCSRGSDRYFSGFILVSTSLLNIE